MKKSEEDGQKKSTSFALSPWIIDRIGKSVREKKYTGQSDIASVALTEHFLLEDIRERDEKLIKIYNILLESEDGRKILSEFTAERDKKIEALNKAGSAMVDLGKYDDAKKYFDEAQRLESPKQKKNPDEETTFTEQLETDTVPKNVTRRTVLK